MSSDRNPSWMDYFSGFRSPPPKPSLMHIICNLKKREFTSPVFVCLQCGKESDTQQAMAAHCKKHVLSGMAKGTVEHIRYCPDHTYTFLCPQPSPRASGSSSAEIVQQQPNHINLQQYPLGNYNPNPILPYAGAPFMSLLAGSSFINGPTQDLINRIDIPPTPGNFQQYVGIGAGSSSSGRFGMNGAGPSMTPNEVAANLDLTLRLNPNPSAADDDATVHANDLEGANVM